MSKVRLTTITPVHVGSGNVLHYGIDYTTQQFGDRSYIGIISPKKVMDKFVRGYENRVNQWVAAIENRSEDIQEFVRRFDRNATLRDYCSRMIYKPPTPQVRQRNEHRRQTKELREHIHNGFGQAYIPGSSIKGAIRTAVLSQMMGDLNDNNVDEIMKGIDLKDKKFAAKPVEQSFFGKEPNSDCFRFLLVGDAMFDDRCEAAIEMINLNQRSNNGYIDNDKSQWVEAITDSKASHPFNICIKTEFYESLYNTAILNQSGGAGKYPIEKSPEGDVSSLFKLINKHTLQLLDEEIEIWKEYTAEEGVSAYLSAIRSVKTQVKQCQQTGECILRVGHASGWRFTTGAWTDIYADKDQWENIVNASRPDNEIKYQDLMFPKSRRISYDGENNAVTLLGFVKLSIVE